MNLFVFTKDIMNYLEEEYIKFFKNNMDKLDTCEYLIPTVVSDLIKDNKVTCDVLKTNAVWYGVTYKEDKEFVVNSINKLIKDKTYPSPLWKK